MDSTRFTEAFQIWVTQLRQDCLQRQNVVRPTDEKGCLSWPTAKVTDTEGGLSLAIQTSTGFKNPRGHGSKLKEAVAQVNWPTPTEAEAQKISNQPNFGQIALSNHPEIRGKPQRAKSHKDYKGIPKVGLLDQDSPSTNGKNRGLWPTPCSDDTSQRKNRYEQGGAALSKQTKGKLNPDWVEQLQGLIVGWTDCAFSAMESSPSRPKKHLDT